MGEGGERAAQEDFPRRRIHSGDSFPFWAIEARSGACGTRSKRDSKCVRARERQGERERTLRGALLIIISTPHLCAAASFFPLRSHPVRCGLPSGQV